VCVKCTFFSSQLGNTSTFLINRMFFFLLKTRKKFANECKKNKLSTILGIG